jgi:hypothetical protein
VSLVGILSTPWHVGTRVEHDAQILVVDDVGTSLAGNDDLLRFDGVGDDA